MERYTQKQNIDVYNKQSKEMRERWHKKKVNIWAHQITL